MSLRASEPFDDRLAPRFANKPYFAKRAMPSEIDTYMASIGADPTSEKERNQASKRLRLLKIKDWHDENSNMSSVDESHSSSTTVFQHTIPVGTGVVVNLTNNQADELNTEDDSVNDNGMRIFWTLFCPSSAYQGSAHFEPRMCRQCQDPCQIFHTYTELARHTRIVP